MRPLTTEEIMKEEEQRTVSAHKMKDRKSVWDKVRDGLYEIFRDVDESEIK
jgi:hypothetical protein